MWIASDVGANTELLKNMKRDVIFKSNALEPILEFKCTMGLIGLLMMSEEEIYEVLWANMFS
jgi:hypothetical protein